VLPADGRADILLENYRAGVMSGSGLPSARRAANPKLIHCSMAASVGP
jgi:crotonobetainyl-CoA:carnitine CoA-transferase CaiB-like acyl-CoA transferase